MKILWFFAVLASGNSQPSPPFFPIGEDDVVVVPMDSTPVPGVEYHTDVLGRRTYLSKACLEELDRTKSIECYRSEIASHNQLLLPQGALPSAPPRKARIATRAPHKREFGFPEGRHYVNVDGNSIRSPVRASSRPAGATARCRDGSWSFSQHHRGTCSHHGGVASW